METDQNSWARPETEWRVRGLQASNRVFARAYHRLNVHTPCRLPAHGPAILVCNHGSSLDPLLIQSTSPRLIRWMMAKEYFAFKSISWVFSTVGVILVERSGRDMAATRAALRALESGYILGVFPEGRFAQRDEMLPFQSGIGLLALKSGAPVFPAYLGGTQRGKGMVQAFVNSNVASLAFGPQVAMPTEGSGRQQTDEATRRIQSAIVQLQKRYFFRPNA